MNVYDELRAELAGEVLTDSTIRHLYATDASVYRQMPGAVVFPANEVDLQKIMQWSAKHHRAVIPRAAGTSLAGQVVGDGTIIDTGRHMRRILSVDPEERTVWVEPGVIRDDLNRALKPLRLFFSPETSSSNRCMIAGMVGNNACGAHSLLYGSTRDHLLEVKGYLSDGSPFHTRSLHEKAYERKLLKNNREGEIYRYLDQILSNEHVRQEISRQSPHPDIRRRNTGYALDLLLQMQPWNPDGKPCNLSTLIAGSEGTLMLISAVKLSLDPLPPPLKVLLCVHFHSLKEAFEGNLIILQHPVSAVELIDHTVLECTAGHLGLKGHRFFIQGDPKAVLIAEIEGDELTALKTKAEKIRKHLQDSSLGYHYPVITGQNMEKVWELRKAGLGLLSNVKGDAKPVPVIEDTAVRPVDLPAYMEDFRTMLDRYGLDCVYYAHAATGELHLRPVLNLKNVKDRIKFRAVATETASLVKKYRGSLSGEHGDGRLRGEFIPMMTGEMVYELFVNLKKMFDPFNLMNPGKITATPPMDTFLRCEPLNAEPAFNSAFDYSSEGGLLKALERCNGSGDCRKPHHYHSLMCPSYQASLDERLSTRGRANLLREILTLDKDNPFAKNELKQILDQCLACKGCKSDCPSSIDMARYKSEVMHQYYQYHRTPFGLQMTVHFNLIYKFLSKFPGLYNQTVSFKPVAALVKKMVGIHPKRSLPVLSSPTMSRWLRRNEPIYLKKKDRISKVQPTKPKLILYIDEFTNLLDAGIGIKALLLLRHLGFEVIPVDGLESGRAALSKGSLTRAKKIARKSIVSLSSQVNETCPLIGVEPSAILSFKDEYPDLVDPELHDNAHQIAENTYLIEDFLLQHFQAGTFGADRFHAKNQKVLIHCHCHQKALCKTGALKEVLAIPTGYSTEEIPSGCCGMAGSFGMERKNYDLSMKIGELILFPAVRSMPDGTILAIAGTGCRQQILDGTGIQAKHPIEILYDALNNEFQYVT